MTGTNKVRGLDDIDHTSGGEGRVYAECGVRWSLNDEGRTLKVFLNGVAEEAVLR